MELNVGTEQINPQEAHRILEADKETLYLDVRTVLEYVAGHPKSALNVPVVLPNPANGQMRLNPEFLHTVEANLPKDAKIIVGCMSGGRSQLAAE
jgi:arsenate reductase